ncbi:MAG: hydroxyacylglutathione hydrolase [Solirubrobacteraceae bacterium]|nr:hydroxyacylglutathione hydrolase [Solirubrobacteraceae bacterium]
MAAMIVERSMNARFLSNTYLVADREGGAGLVIDAGGPVKPLLAAAERLGVTPSHVLLTQHHHDHVSELPLLLGRWPEAVALIHPLERDEVAAATGTIEAGERLTIGELDVRPLHTPGHTAGMLSFLVDHRGEQAVFTGDTLFRNSVGGVRAPGHTSYQDLKDSIMGTLMELDRRTVIHPGHTDPTTVAEEWETNSFIRVWRGLDREGQGRCRALGEPATLVLWGDDYDGGHKAWVRWPDGRDDIVPGSQVKRTS